MFNSSVMALLVIKFIIIIPLRLVENCCSIDIFSNCNFEKDSRNLCLLKGRVSDYFKWIHSGASTTDNLTGTHLE